jgi:hypothetical protein
MEKILIDKFIVPEPSKASFLESAHRISAFSKPCPALWKDSFTRRKMEKANTTI